MQGIMQAQLIFLKGKTSTNSNNMIHLIFKLLYKQKTVFDMHYMNKYSQFKLCVFMHILYRPCSGLFFI